MEYQNRTQMARIPKSKLHYYKGLKGGITMQQSPPENRREDETRSSNNHIKKKKKRQQIDRKSMEQKAQKIKTKNS